MAYRFATDAHTVEFDKTPFNGYTLGGYTAAVLIKRSTLATRQGILFISDLSFPYFQFGFTSGGTNDLMLASRTTAGGSPTVIAGLGLASTSLWYLIVVTGNGAAIPTFHLYDGTSWVHSGGSAPIGATIAFGSSQRVWISPPSGWGSEYFKGDIVCCGFKKSDSSNVTVETLTTTAFSSWQAFGFEWLVGFESAGTLTNRGSSAGGGEIARVGTSVVSDPPGWAWPPRITEMGAIGVKNGSNQAVAFRYSDQPWWPIVNANASR